jgi:hypothetical protein
VERCENKESYDECGIETRRNNIIPQRLAQKGDKRTLTLPDVFGLDRWRLSLTSMCRNQVRKQ